MSDHAWQASKDQLARLWEHALLQDELFVQRSNFFLVAESLLVVAYTGILGLSLGTHGQPLRLRVAALVLAIFGFLLTTIWAFANRACCYHADRSRWRDLPVTRRSITTRTVLSSRMTQPSSSAFCW